MAKKPTSGNRKSRTEKRAPESQAAAQVGTPEPVSASASAYSDGIPDVRERLRLVRELIEKVAERIKNEDVKSTMAEFLRLCGVAQELEALLPRDIEVTWVDPR